MRIESVFGVKAKSLEEAREILEGALKMKAVARENDSRGGDYYSFDGLKEEEVLLVKNRDLYDDEPIYPDAADWEFVVYAHSPDAESDFMRALDHEPKRLVKVTSETYE
jgi:hypothetical protein